MERAHVSRLNPAWRGGLYYFALWGAAAIMSPYLNVHYTRLGLTGVQVGLLAALGPLVRLTVGPLLSALADRHGWRKRMLTLAILGLGGLTLVLGGVRSFFLILPVALGIFVAHSTIHPIGDALIARMAKRHGVDYGSLRLWGSLGFAGMALLTGALWERLGFGYMFPVAAVAMVGVALAAQGLEEAARRAETAEHLPLTNLARDWGLLALLVAHFLVGVGEGFYVTFSGVYMDALGGSEWMIGGFFGFSALVELPVMRYSGALARRIGKPLTLLLGYAVLGLTFLGFILARSPLFLLFCGMLKGVGYGLSFPTTVSLADDRAPAAWTSTVQSLLSALGWGLAPLITIPLAGWLSDRLGLGQIFWFAAIGQVLAMLVLGVALISGRFRIAPLVAGEVV